MGSKTEDGFEVYSERVIQLAYEPLNIGRIEDPDAITLVKGQCGDRMSISIKMKEGKIDVIRFLTDGCGATVACGSAVTELAKGKTPWNARKIHPQTIIQYLDGLPPSHLHCAALAVQALRQTLDQLEDEPSGASSQNDIKEP
jgi:nitrogen fixation NifU-like protein